MINQAQQISPEESAHRAKFVRNATANAGLEGIFAPPELAAIFQEYVTGQLTLEEMRNVPDP